jgi:hypothetical protein
LRYTNKQSGSKDRAGQSQVINRRGGTAGEFSVNGQGTVSNYYTVDGVAANTGAAPSGIGNGGGFSGVSANETVLGTTQSLISIDAMQEFRATTSSYSAEYGRTPGGQFSFASRAGANEVHGTVFDYLRNAALDANNTFNKLNHTARQTEHQNDFGGTFGGPVWIPHLYDGHNRTFFFFSYEGLRLTTPVAAALTGVPSLVLRQDPRVTGALKQVLNSFPLPNAGTDLGNGLATFTAGYTSPSHVDSSSLRLDHSFNEHFKIFGRAAYTPSSIVTQDKGDMAILDSSLGKTRLITLGATNILSASSTNNLRFNLTANNQDTAQTLSNFGGATPFSFSDLPGYADPTQDNFQFALSYSIKAQMDVAPVSTRQRQINVVDTFTRLIGRHTLHFGMDYRRLLTDASRPPLYEYAYAASAAEIYKNSLDGIEAQKYVGEMRPVNTNYSFYAEDEWKVTRRLNLSLGLRWEINPAPQDASGNNPFAVTTNNPVTAQLAPWGTRLWQTQYGNLAPRFGLAYQAHQTAGYETVLRLGGGIFYDVPPSNAAQGYSGVGSSATINPTSVSFPLAQNVLDAIPAPNASAPYAASVYGLDPHLSTPYTLQWNAALEQGLGKSQSLTITYVAALGRQLYLQKEYQPYYLGNGSFGPSATLFLFRNSASSGYNSLQTQFNRKMARRLQFLASYTWAHGIDDANTNAAVYQSLRSVSDNDIRNNAQASLTYEIPGHYNSGLVSAIFAHWSLATRVTARSALPIDLVGYQAVAAGRGFNITYHPNVVPDVPEYLSDPAVISGRRINPAAFQVAVTGSGATAKYYEGDSGRNSLRAYDAIEANLAAQKEFHLLERTAMSFRVEAFNLFNHPNYGAVYSNLQQAGLFGTVYNTLNNQLQGLNSLYQTGGPRSLQAALRLRF